MSLKYQALMTGEKELLALLGELPERVQNRVFRFAGRKAGNAVAKRAGELSPRRRTNVHGPRTQRHLADSFINKQKVYRASETTVNIVGGQTGAMGHNKINHLVEFGTNDRYTGRRTVYRRTPPVWITRNRKVKTASGGVRTIKERVLKGGKKSLESTRAEYIRQRTARKQSIGREMFRGRMPAFHQLERAVAETNVSQIFENEIRAGLQRIADRAAKAG